VADTTAPPYLSDYTEGTDGTDPVAAERARRVREVWSRMGGKLGVGFSLTGFLVIFLGWNGAAGVDRVPAQMPYLISGGFAGLALVVVGVGLLVVQSNRADRAALQATIRELRDALGQGLAQGAAPPPGDSGAYRPAGRRAPATTRPSATARTRSGQPAG
jgi:hypothetical protein